MPGLPVDSWPLPARDPWPTRLRLWWSSHRHRYGWEVVVYWPVCDVGREVHEHLTRRQARKVASAALNRYRAACVSGWQEAVADASERVRVRRAHPERTWKDT